MGLQANPTAVHLDQYGSGDNERTHYETTGPEIFEQVEGELDCMVGAVNTGGTLTGAGSFLKERIPDLRLVGVEPVGSTIFTTENSDYPYMNAGSGLDMACKRVVARARGEDDPGDAPDPGRGRHDRLRAVGAHGCGAGRALD